MKSHTDLSQSKKLAEFLPLESADMCYCNDGTSIKIDATSYSVGVTKWEKYLVELIPCWSLAALLDVLPNDWWGYNKHYFLEISKMGDMSAPYRVSYFRFREQFDGANFDRIEHIYFQSDNPIDACVAMIEKLNELKML